MTATTKRNEPDRHRDGRRAARRREMVQGMLLLAVLIVLAFLAKLPTA
jgi:hypothetical protein